MKTLEDAVSYLLSLGYKKGIDFSFNQSIQVIDFNINYSYFCSLAFYEEGCNEDGCIEIYELGHGGEVDDNGFYITDGELWQYRLYKKLKCAIDFALKCKKNNRLPSKPLKVW